MSQDFRNDITIGGIFTDEKITKLMDLAEEAYLYFGSGSYLYRQDIEEKIKTHGEAFTMVGTFTDKQTVDFLDGLREMGIQYRAEIGAEFGADAEIRSYDGEEGSEERKCYTDAQGSIVIGKAVINIYMRENPDATVAQMMEFFDLEVFEQAPEKTFFEEVPVGV